MRFFYVKTVNYRVFLHFNDFVLKKYIDLIHLLITF